MIERQVGNVTTQNAYFVTPKIKALQSGTGGVSLTLRLAPQLHARYALVGQRIAGGAEGLDVTVLNQTDLSIFMKASGSQYLTTTSTAVIPLSSLLGGAVDIGGSHTLTIQVILTATTITALDTTKSIAVVSGPLSVVATTPASAMAVTRLSILLDILQCGLGDGDDSGNNLVGISIGPASGSSLRGAVVGNLAIVAAFVMLFGLMFATLLVHGHCVHSAPPAAMLEDLLDIFHFPGIVMLPIAAVAQPTLTATVQLIALSPVDGDVVFGALGAAVLVLLFMMPYTIVITTQFCLALTEPGQHPKTKLRADASQPQHTPTVTAAPPEAQPPSIPRQIFNVLFGERKTWQPVDPTRRDQVAWKKRFAPVFLDCSTWWYPLADLWMSAFVGVAGGLTLGNQSVCFFQLAVVTLSYAFIATLQMIVAPPLVFASRCYVMALQVLGLVSCGAVLAAAVANENNASSLSVSIASMCMLIIAAITTVKSCLDIVFILLAIPGRLRRASRVGALHSPHAKAADLGACVVNVAGPSTPPPRLLRGGSSMSQVSVGSVDLHYSGIDVVAVSPSPSDISLDADSPPAFQLDIAAALQPRDADENTSNNESRMKSSAKLLTSFESSLFNRSMEAAEVEQIANSLRAIVEKLEQQKRQKTPALRRGGSFRHRQAAPAAADSGNPATAAAAGLDLDNNSNPRDTLLSKKASSMRRLGSPEGGPPPLLRQGTSFNGGGGIDEQERSHLTKRAALMLRVDSAPRRVNDGANADGGDLQQHYHGIDRTESFSL
jgi:hypothetical protein